MAVISELLFFGIEAAVRLARVGRTIYAEETLREELVIPLPAAFTSPRARAREYALSLRLSEDPRYRALFKRDFEAAFLDENDQAITDGYLLHVQRGWATNDQGTSARLAGLAAVGQWAKGEEPFPHPLQRVAGTLIDIGVDYLNECPGAINTESSTGAAVRSFMAGLEDVDFGDAQWDDIVVSLFSAGLESIVEQPDLFRALDMESSFLRGATQAIATDLRDRLDALEGLDLFSGTETLRAYGTSILRGVLSSAAATLAEGESLFARFGEDGTALIGEVGAGLLDVLTDADSQLGDRLGGMLTGGQLDALMGECLTLCSKALPNEAEMAGRAREWTIKLLGQFDTALPCTTDLLSPQALAQIVQTTVQAGTKDVERLLTGVGDQAAILPTLVGALTDGLSQQMDKAAAAAWRFGLDDAHAQAAIEATVTTLARNTHWLAAEELDALRSAPIALSLLGQLSDGRWLQTLLETPATPDVLAAVIESGILDAFDTGDVEATASSFLVDMVQPAMDAVIADGRTGLARLTDPAALQDFLSAITQAGCIDALLDEAESSAAVIERIVAVSRALRSGITPPIGEMVTALAPPVSAPTPVPSGELS